MKNYFLLFIFFGWTQFSFAETVEFKSRDLRFSESTGYNGKAFGWDNLITVKGDLYLPNRKNDAIKSPAVILLRKRMHQEKMHQYKMFLLWHK